MEGRRRGPAPARAATRRRQRGGDRPALPRKLMPSQERSPRGGRGGTRGFQARVTVTFSEVEGPPLSDFPKPACPGGWWAGAWRVEYSLEQCSSFPEHARALGGSAGPGRGALGPVCSSATVLAVLLSKRNPEKPVQWFIIKLEFALLPSVFVGGRTIIVCQKVTVPLPSRPRWGGLGGVMGK